MHFSLLHFRQDEVKQIHKFKPLFAEWLEILILEQQVSLCGFMSPGCRRGCPRCTVRLEVALRAFFLNAADEQVVLPNLSHTASM